MQSLLHIYRNTPMGRETLLQSMYFSEILNLKLYIYIPEFTQCMMYFKKNIVTINLDKSYTNHNINSKENLNELFKEFTKEYEFLELDQIDYTAKTPVLPNSFSFMCCPRVMGDLSLKFPIGHIGSNVRKIINNAVFPVLIPSAVFKKWNSITAFFGGSKNSLKVLEISKKISEISKLPLNIFTYLEHEEVEKYEVILNELGLLNLIKSKKVNWIVKKDGDFTDNLFSVPHDSLITIGSFGHGVIKDLIFGSKMEKVQENLPNTMLIVGHNYQEIE